MRLSLLSLTAPRIAPVEASCALKEQRSNRQPARKTRIRPGRQTDRDFQCSMNPHLAKAQSESSTFDGRQECIYHRNQAFVCDERSFFDDLPKLGLCAQVKTRGCP